MGQNSYSLAYHQGVIASRAKQSLPENRDCFVAYRSSQWQHRLLCYFMRPEFCLTIL